MYEFLLLDLDDTILDFHKAEHIALSKTLRSFGVEPTDEVCNRYSRINQEHWQRLERKELTRAQVLLGRFSTLIEEMHLPIAPENCAGRYEELLAQGHYFLPGAKEALEVLCTKYRLFLVSNGTARVQSARLKSAGISRMFEGIFISQEIGADKPDTAYFSRCFARIPGFAKERAMIVGDSLTSDILGGCNAGIATCWVNPSHAPGRADIRADYEIESLAQLDALLEEL